MNSVPLRERLAPVAHWLQASGARLAQGLVALAITPFVARALGREGVGDLAKVQMAPLLLGNLASLGTPYVLVHYGSRAPKTLKALYRRSLRVSTYGALLGIAVGFALSLVIARDDPHLRTTYWLYLPIIPIYMWQTLSSESFRPLGHFATWSWVVFLRGRSGH